MNGSRRRSPAGGIQHSHVTPSRARPEHHDDPAGDRRSVAVHWPLATGSVTAEEWAKARSVENAMVASSSTDGDPDITRDPRRRSAGVDIEKRYAYRQSVVSTVDAHSRGGTTMAHNPTPTPAQQKPRRDWWTFDRSDRWGLAILLTAVVVATTMAAIVVPIQRWIAGDGIPVPFRSEVSVAALDAVGTNYGPADYTVTLADPSTTQRLLDLVPGTLMVLLLAAGCWLIIAVMRTIAAGDPFSTVNVRRLRALAAMLLLGPAITSFVTTSIQGALLGDIPLGGLAYALTIDIPWAGLIAGLLLALLAEAFKAGSRLRDDVDGLI